MYYDGQTTGVDHAWFGHVPTDSHHVGWFVVWYNGCASDRSNGGCYRSGCHDLEGDKWHGTRVVGDLVRDESPNCASDATKGAFGTGVTFR